MKLDYAPRRSGKTTRVIKIASETGAYILTINRTEASRIVKMAEELGLQIRNPVSLEEMISSGMHTGFVKNLVIDNVDMILQRLFARNKIIYATWSSTKPEDAK